MTDPVITVSSGGPGNGAPGSGGPGNPGNNAPREEHQQSLSTTAARLLTTTTKSPPQTTDISPRWLLKMIPWVEVDGVFRVNRRLTYMVGDGRLAVINTGARVQIIPQELYKLPLLQGFTDVDDLVVSSLANQFVQREYQAGEVIVQAGQPAEHVVVIAHGKAQKLRKGKYGDDIVLDSLADGDHIGDQAVVQSNDQWPFTLKAVTPCIVLSLPQRTFEVIITQSPVLHAHVERYRERLRRPQDKNGQAEIELAAGHRGEPELPGTFVDYDLHPREYELSVAQTMLRVHTRVSDLFNNPMVQVEEQLRLTVEALRERQEFEMFNNREFGLLHNVDLRQRVQARTGPPTPDDLDELLSRRRKSRFMLAHPRAIAAFGQECNRRGVYPTCVEVQGQQFTAWRGVPLLPTDKIPISSTGTTSIIVMRTGMEDQGVVGLHRTGIPDEIQPSLSARRMDINDRAITSYLVSAYYSIAPLVPDALGMLENIQLGR